MSIFCERGLPIRLATSLLFQYVAYGFGKPAYNAATDWVRAVDRALEKRGVFRVFAGTPSSQPTLFAVQHTTLWETLMPFLWERPKPPVIIAKQELTKVPFLGSAMKKLGCIFVDRERPDLQVLLRETEAAIAQGRDVVIFPEGTRKPVPEVKPGVALLWRRLGVPLQVVTHNAHERFPSGSWCPIVPGIITLHFQAVYEPGRMSGRRLLQQINQAFGLAN